MKFWDVPEWLVCLVILLCLWTNYVRPATQSESGGWSEWSICSQTCDSGVQRRNKTCAGCVETRACNTLKCRDTALMAGIVVGVTIVSTGILLVSLLWIFFIKPGVEKMSARKSSMLMLESTPGLSRRTRTCTVDSNLTMDVKMSVLGQTGSVKGLGTSRTLQSSVDCQLND